jgi:CheY-like chemotaxis protein
MSERYCILCVDDDVSCLEARTALLEEEGYSVTATSCPLRALELDVTKFHLAVLDLAMPAMNGFQLLLRLRAARASFPIVLLSGMSRDLPDNMRSVFSSCLDKGEPIDILLNTIRSFLTLSPDPPEFRITDNDARSLYRRHGL